MDKKRFQKTKIVDKWGGIYDSETDKVLGVNDVEHKLNEQQATITELEEETEVLLENLFERQEDFRKNEKECHERIMNYQKEIKGLKNIIFNLKNEIHNLKNDNDYYIDKRRFDLYD